MQNDDNSSSASALLLLDNLTDLIDDCREQVWRARVATSPPLASIDEDDIAGLAAIAKLLAAHIRVLEALDNVDEDDGEVTA